MAIKKIDTPAKKITKKTISKELQSKISDALSGYKSLFELKDFESKVKKASKLFATDVLKEKKIKVKKVIVKKKVAVKKTVK